MASRPSPLHGMSTVRLFIATTCAAVASACATVMLAVLAANP